MAGLPPRMHASLAPCMRSPCNLNANHAGVQQLEVRHLSLLMFEWCVHKLSKTGDNPTLMRRSAVILILIL